MASFQAKFNIVESKGNPYDCGFLHGKTLKPIIQNIISEWAKNIKESTSLSLDAYAKKIKNETLLFKTIQQLAPDLLEEVHGIADGAEMPHHIIEAWQYLDEHEWFIKDFILSKKESTGNACSTFGFENSGQVILGQNLDIPSYKNGIQTILKTTNTQGFSSMIFTQAGALASLGINNSPIAICVNSLTQLAYRIDGLPVTYLIRKILQNKTLESAANTIKTLPHATGHNYLIGSPNNFLNLECSANQTTLIESSKSNCVFHTNHILQNQDKRPGISPEALLTIEQRIKESSLPRLEALKSDLNIRNILSVVEAQKILSKQPVSISLKKQLKQFTFISVVFDLCANTKVWATPGAPEEFSYNLIEWPL
jgi:predicted choloylglycine hydrolase